MTILRLISILVVMMIMACSRNGQSDKTIKIEIGKSDPVIHLSSICSVITYIPLQTTSESLLGEIRKARLSNKRIYFLNGYANQRIIGFNLFSGIHLLTINQNGQGPGEYVNATDLIVNKEDAQIEVYSRGLKKIIQYDGEGNYIDEFKTEYFISGFTKTEKEYYLHVELSSSAAIVHASLDLKDFQTLFEFKRFSFGDITNFSSFNDTVSFGASIISEISHLKGTDFETAYQFDYLANNMPKDFLNKDFKDVIQLIREMKTKKYVYNEFFVAESENFIVTRLNDRRIVIYNKNTGNLKQGKTIADDIHKISPSYSLSNSGEFQLLALEGNCLYFGIEPTHFFNNKQELITNSRIGEVIKNIGINDNLILIKCELKNF